MSDRIEVTAMEDRGIGRVVGATILLSSGSYFDFENPEASLITIYDVAHALSNLCRFTGHCHSFYSVAEHSVHVSRLVPPRDALAGLLHDAVEAVVGDMSRPLKSLLPSYKEIERRCEAAILARFGLPPELPESVKRADIAMLAIEQAQAMDAADHIWPGVTGAANAADGIDVKLEFLSPIMAQRAFLARFWEVRE